MTPPLVVPLRERGGHVVAPEAWALLSASPDFWDLAERKIVAVKQPARGRIRLSGGSHVGRALINGVQIEIAEKVDGALSSLLRYATRDAFRVQRTATATSDLGRMIAILVHEFLETVQAYIARGREFHYVRKASVGALAGGRLDITRTIGLRARGMRHLLAFDRTVLSRNTLKNRLLAAALHEVENIVRLVPIDAADVATARAMSAHFADCLDRETMFGDRERLAETALRVADDAPESDQDMLALAGVILSNRSLEPSTSFRGVAPRSWFLNLETLFEETVRRVMGRLSPNLDVVKGLASNRRIFSGVSGRYRADPDLVLSRDGMVIAVGDVKYKDWSGAAGEDDLYQLLIHASAFGTATSFLVFPGESFSAHDLGVSTTGCRTWVFVFDVREPEEGARRALNTLGV